ncbi:MAG: hypothetical protein S0880_19615, partial [Actinomycetota bacterium]|nr:hypothetical protein [Actinomycetota bacterium]
MASQKVRPSGWWYLLGVFMIILGFVLAAVVGVNGIVSLDDEVRGFGRVPVPGEAALELDDGDYTVYFEPTLGTSPDNEPNHGAMLGVVSITDPAGADVALEVYETNFEYSFGGESGFAILTFNAPSQGVYTVTATDAQAAGIAPAGQIAIGRSLTDGLGRTLLIAIGVFVLLLVVAIGVMIALAVMRGRSKKRIAAAAPQGFGSTDGRPPGAPPVPGAPPTGPPPPGWNSAPRATWPPPASDGAPPPGSAAPAGAPQGGSSVPPPWEQQPQQAPSTPPPWEQQPPPAPSPQAPQPNPHPPQA